MAAPAWIFKIFLDFFPDFVPREADNATDSDFEFGREGLEMAMHSRTQAPIEMPNRPPLKRPDGHAAITSRTSAAIRFIAAF